VGTPDNGRKNAKAGLAYGAHVAERLRSCTWSGPLAGADAAGEAGSISCGSLVRIELRVRGGVIEEARYQAHGCPATLASASQVCAEVMGIPFVSAAALTEQQICSSLGLVASKESTATVALDALHQALGAALSSATLDVAADLENRYRGGVLVGMSGGVDSAVAALLLRDQGYPVVGVTLTLWSDPQGGDERSCCSPANVGRARRVAHALGVPHFALDASGAFYRDVVDYFVTEYASGRTPNPCAKCNSRVRLGLLLETACRLGLSNVATGHYARLTGTPPRLTRGADRSKDQSYVLAEVSPAILEHLIFPLGEMRKPEVRALAARAGLEGHSAPESQEICFVADDDHHRFLRERLGDLPGDIVDGEGSVLGQHRGTYNFTVGQRRGLHVAVGDPRYVVAIDAARRLVQVGTALECGVTGLEVEGLVWHRRPGGEPGALQVRSAGAAIPVASMHDAAGALTIALEHPAIGVAPGQTAVLYEADQVVVAGTIASTHSGPE
jgi:tRNA-uridine 2-sulfurtransferase